MSTPTIDTAGTVVAPVPGSGKVARLAVEAAEAAAVRELTTAPDVIALRVERVRGQVDRLLWAGILLGLAFTTVNVQTFAASGAPLWSPGWWVAWLLDPMVSLVLLAVLRAEQVTARYQVELNGWARRTKWLTFAATYVMNTWTSWGLTGGTPFSAAGVVLHSVPPLVVFFAAETGPDLRDRLTEAVRRSLAEHPAGMSADGGTADRGAADGAAPDLTVPVHTPVQGGVHGAVQGAVHGEVHEPATATRPGAVPTGGSVRRRPARRKAAPRRLLADYVAAARGALDAAHAAGEPVEITPAWCRRVSGCSAGTSVKVAAALRQPAPVTESVSVPVEARRAA